MKKLTFFSVLSIVLVLINIILLAYLFGFKNDNVQKPLPGEGPKKLIIEKLHFDEAQAIQYQVLIDEHRSSVRETERSIQKLKSELYKTLSNTATEEEKQAIIEAIGEKHQELENIHLKHFSDIKQLCTKEQLKYFDELTEELAALFRRPPPPRRRN